MKTAFEIVCDVFLFVLLMIQAVVCSLAISFSESVRMGWAAADSSGCSATVGSSEDSGILGAGWLASPFGDA